MPSSELFKSIGPGYGVDPAIDKALDKLADALDAARAVAVLAEAVVDADGVSLDRGLVYGINDAIRRVYQERLDLAAYAKSGEPERLAAEDKAATPTEGSE